MLGHRELTLQDYAGILKRRFWLIIITAVVTLGVGIGVSYVIPPQYTSQTLVIIEQQKVPESYVKPVVTEDLGERLASMKEQILSRSRIQPIIEHFNLYGGGRDTMDERVELTRKAIGIIPIRSEQAHGGMPGFFISFKARDAHTAQQVCGEITSLFVSENLSAREQSAEGTTDFLKQQLGDAKRNLDEQDAKLAAFQTKYIGKLPEQTATNTNTLQALTTQLDAANQAVNRIQQDETFLEAMIAQQAQEEPQAQPTATGTTEDALHTQLREALAKKKDLDSLYTPDHPDVVALSREIASLQAEIKESMAAPVAPAPGQAPVRHTDSPQLQQLKAQLRAARQSMTAAKQEQARIGQQVSRYTERVESSPAVEQEYKQITRDHETAQGFYNSLLAKMNESSMATNLERRQQGEQFQVMDAPNLPDEPSFPNRLVFAGGGLAGGLVLGLLLGALIEYRDTSLRNERDIWAFTQLPTLAVISHLNELAQSGRPAKKPKKPRKAASRMPKPLESARG